MTAVQIVECPDPDCGLPADVLDEWDTESTDGPVHHIRTRCVDGDVFVQIGA